jgi:molybdopterin converting factor small subunit
VRVTAVLLGLHRALLPPGSLAAGSVTLEYAEDGVPVSRVREAVGIAADAARIVFLEGRAVNDETILRDGQTVTFVSPVGGG